MDELLEQFLIEGRELLQQATDDLLALEREPAIAMRLDSLFRAIHTLKGSTGIFDMAPMGRALHAAEDLLGSAKANGTIDLPQLNSVLDCIGRCDEWIEAISRTGSLPARAGAESAQLVAAMLIISTNAGPPSAGQTATSWLSGFVQAEHERLAAAIAGSNSLTVIRYNPQPDCFFLGDDPLALVRALPGLVALRLLPQHHKPGELFDPFRCQVWIEAATSALLDDVHKVFRFVSDQVETAILTEAELAEAVLQAGHGADEQLWNKAKPKTQPPPGEMRSSGSGIIRVAAAHVDQLIDVAGELIVANNSLAHLLQRVAALDPASSNALSAARALVDRLTNEIHHRSLRLRLVPLSQTFGRFPRLVRETATATGKSIVFDVQGDTVEVDKAIADGLFEPLLHLLRNAVDHGIEDTIARLAAGKTGSGHIMLHAERQGNMVAVTVTDDGGGIDIARVRETAADRGVLSREAIAGLDEAAVRELLFTPGFSTALLVTDVSGRGVGLDIVRASVAALGGTVTLESVRGQGSTFRLLLPQRASIAAILVVRVADQRYGIPVETVSEMVRLRASAVKLVHHGEAFVHRGITQPLLSLGGLLADGVIPARDDRDLRVLLIRAGNKLAGLEVEEVEGRLDILLRPPAGLLTANPAVTGTALLGDGSVLMILDVAELIG